MLIPPASPELFSKNKISLGALQELFAVEFAYLILYINSVPGYATRLGDLFRDPRVHGEVGIAKGYSHPRSAHKKKLAGDINLFLNGKFLSATRDHQIFGEWWEARSPYHRWGGRFNDGNHYSFIHEGTM